MIRSRSIARAAANSVMALAVMAGSFAPALAADPGHGVEIERQQWPFSGITGTYNKEQLQRGFGVYKEVCAACHSMSRIAFRNLAEPGGPEFDAEQVKALAATYEVPAAPNEEGEVKPRPALLSDRFPPLYPNEKAARAAHAQPDSEPSTLLPGLLTHAPACPGRRPDRDPYRRRAGSDHPPDRIALSLAVDSTRWQRLKNRSPSPIGGARPSKENEQKGQFQTHHHFRNGVSAFASIPRYA